LHALDAMRAYALLLGVVLHSAAGFLQDFPMPMWQEEPNAIARVIYYVIHMFRMSAFFLIAGFFGRMVLERRGAKAFIKDRAKRIAIPLFLFGPVVLLMISVVFYALALGLRALVRAVDPRGSIAAVSDRIVAFLMSGVWGPVLIALPIAAYVWQLESWTEWIGLPAPQELIPTALPLIGYGIPFALGWLLHRQAQRLLEHLATVMFFLTMLRPYDWHWTIKFAIMIGGSMLILLPSYHYFVRFTWIGAILNGRRHPRSVKSPPADAAPAPG
jgi:hypothetical protein